MPVITDRCTKCGMRVLDEGQHSKWCVGMIGYKSRMMELKAENKRLSERCKELWIASYVAKFESIGVEKDIATQTAESAYDEFKDDCPVDTADEEILVWQGEV